MSSEKASSASDSTDHRRKWDTKEFEAKAQERLNAEKEEEEGEFKPKMPKIKRELLKHRDYKVDLDSKLGRSVVINKTTPSAESGGYYCDVCDCVVKDSINFLDHINGKNHQRNMGMSMRVKRSTVDEVKERLLVKKIEKEQAKYEGSHEARAEDVKEEEARMADYRAQKRKENRKRKSHQQDDLDQHVDPDVAALMGFGGFVTSKKKK